MSRETKLLLIVSAIFLLAAVWNFVVWPIEPSGPSSRVGAEPNNGGGVTSGGAWLVIATIVGSLLTLGGTYLNDRNAAVREDRRSEREAQEQRRRWEREDRLKEEEQSETHRQQVREKRAPAYKAFVVATSFPAPFERNQQAEFAQALNERYTEVVLYCSVTLEHDAEKLYNRAMEALAEPEDDEDVLSRQKLREARAEFWDSVRVEAQEDYSHS